MRVIGQHTDSPLSEEISSQFKKKCSADWRSRRCCYSMASPSSSSADRTYNTLLHLHLSKMLMNDTLNNKTIV